MASNSDQRALKKELLKCSLKELQKRLRKQKIKFKQNSTKTDLIDLLLKPPKKKKSRTKSKNKKAKTAQQKINDSLLFIPGKFKCEQLLLDLLVSGFSRIISVKSICQIIESYLDLPYCHITYTAADGMSWGNQIYAFLIFNSNLLASNISLKLCQQSNVRSLDYGKKWDNNFECGVIGINVLKIKRFCKQIQAILQRNKSAKPMRELLQNSSLDGLYKEAYFLQWNLDTSSFDYWNLDCHGFNKKYKNWKVCMESSYTISMHQKYLFDYGHSIQICIDKKDKTLCFVKNKKYLLDQSADRNGSNGGHEQFVNGFVQLMGKSNKIRYFPFLVAAKSFKLEIQLDCPRLNRFKMT